MAHYLPLAKAGPLRNGAERGGGSIYHAVPHHKPEIWMTATNCGPALCGQMPRVQWSSEPGQEVTCHRCLRRLAKMEAA